MKSDEPSDYVRLAATNALLNSLEFTKANFDNQVSSIIARLVSEKCEAVYLYKPLFINLQDDPSLFALVRKCAVALHIYALDFM